MTLEVRIQNSTLRVIPNKTLGMAEVAGEVAGEVTVRSWVRSRVRVRARSLG